MSATGSAPGKVILLGEHAVVYGHPALASAISRRVFVSLCADPSGPKIELPSGMAAPAELTRAFAGIAEEVGAPPSLRAEVHSEIPLGAGLGSSAALGVALARALCALAARPCPPQEAARMALRLESIFHGAASGVDPAVCAHGGLLLFQRAGKGSPERLAHIRPQAPLHLVVAMTGIARGTHRTVLPLAQRRGERPQLYDPLLAALGELARGGAESAAKGDLQDLGVRFEAAHGILAALGVSSPELEDLVRSLRRDGALGAKLTGAGGGGAAIGLAREAAEAEALAARTRGRGLAAFAAAID